MLRNVLIGLCFIVCLPTCKDKKALRHDEDLQAVVTADRNLEKQETALLSRRGALQRERRRLRDKRAEIASRKLVLSTEDAQERKKLDEEESRLAHLESSLLKQEMNLNTKLHSLLDEKSGLLNKLTKDKDKDSKDTTVVRREYAVALREKDLSRRESELAQREKTLAVREQSLAERQAKLCPGGTTTVIQTAAPPPASSGGSYSRKDVDPIYRAALNVMQAKGVLTADLPEGADRLVTDVRHGVSSGDFVRAKHAADQLLSIVRKIKIDRAFIGSKINRLSATMRRSPPPAKNREKVNGLFQQATASYGDGKFKQANKLLNQIYSLF